MWTRIKAWFTARWVWITGNKVATVVIVVLAFTVLGLGSAHLRINRRTATAREEKQYRQQHETRITALETGVQDPSVGILAQLKEIRGTVGNHETRIVKVEKAIEDPAVGILAQLREIKAISHTHEAAIDEPATSETEQPVAEEPTAEPEEPVARAAATPRAPAKAPAKATKPVRKTARAERSEPSEAPAPADEYLARARRDHKAKSDELAAARRESGGVTEDVAAADAAHTAVEHLFERAVEGRPTTTEEEAAVERHRRLYQPAPLRPTAWRDVRPDETCVVHAGGR